MGEGVGAALFPGQQREAEAATLGQPSLGHPASQRPDPTDRGRALGHGNHTPGFEQVEGVGGLDALIISRQRQRVRGGGSSVGSELSVLPQNAQLRNAMAFCFGL